MILREKQNVLHSNLSEWDNQFVEFKSGELYLSRQARVSIKEAWEMLEKRG